MSKEERKSLKVPHLFKRILFESTTQDFPAQQENINLSGQKCQRNNEYAKFVANKTKVSTKSTSWEAK